MDPLVTTTRLTLREWSDDDAPAALAIYGATQVARWLTPAVERIADLEAMRSALQTWQQRTARAASTAGPLGGPSQRRQGGHRRRRHPAPPPARARTSS